MQQNNLWAQKLQNEYKNLEKDKTFREKLKIENVDLKVDHIIVDFKSQNRYLEDIKFRFELDCKNYPHQAPFVKFDKGISHVSIFAGTGKFCIVEFGDMGWESLKQKSKIDLKTVVELIIENFNKDSSDCEYPVDPGELELNVEERNERKIRFAQIYQLQNVQIQQQQNEKKKKIKIISEQQY